MEKHERKSRTSKLRRIETGIWFLIIVVFISIGIFVLNKYENSFETHKIYMPDVDGLIVGSPVNLMGIPVGYVTKTKIINDDEVVVKFKITNKSIHIQEGTIATVEFSGLGGSKSLELFPPSSNKHITNLTDAMTELESNPDNSAWFGGYENGANWNEGDYYFYFAFQCIYLIYFYVLSYN